MEKLNITQGECKVDIYGSLVANNASVLVQGVGFPMGSRHIEAEHNAILLADAINTYNTTPILPSELLKQRNELLAALFELRNAVFSENDIRVLAASQSAKDLINKINSEQ